jgi:hypothetical protein
MQRLLADNKRITAAIQADTLIGLHRLLYAGQPVLNLNYLARTSARRPSVSIFRHGRQIRHSPERLRSTPITYNLFKFIKVNTLIARQPTAHELLCKVGGRNSAGTTGRG